MISFRDLGQHTKYPIAGSKPKETASPQTEPAAKANQISANDAATLLGEKGWIEIHSKDLDCNFYLIRRPLKGSLDKPPNLPNPDLHKYFLDEIESLAGLPREQVSFTHQQKIDFGGTTYEPACYGNGWEKVFPVKGEPYWRKGNKTVLVKNSHDQKRKEYLARKKYYAEQKANRRVFREEKTEKI